LIATEDQYVIYDLSSKQVIDVIVSKKKSQGNLQLPYLIDISHDDLYTIEAIQ